MMIGSYIVPGFQSNMPGFNGRVSATVESPTDDLSGNTHSTDRADKGVKPKKLNVSFSLRFTEKDYLTALVELQEARDANDEAIKYPVISPLSTVLRIRQVQFSGTANIAQDDVLKCWHINFALVEYRSVPEAAAKRSGSSASKKDTFDELVKRMEA